LARPGPVHVASHGTLNAWNPLFSRIELVRPRTGANPSNDGRLEVHELLGIVIRSPLVFFSGCETGRARAVTRDPVRGTVDLTLAQAALAAGAANVISTLWRIDDAGAGEFAARFYAHLKGSSVAHAVARAQRELIADTRYASPYYWAGYTWSGAGRAGGGSQEGLSASVSSPIGRSPVTH
jgi:CHAT domain-containing protein